MASPSRGRRSRGCDWCPGSSDAGGGLPAGDGAEPPLLGRQPARPCRTAEAGLPLADLVRCATIDLKEEGAGAGWPSAGPGACPSRPSPLEPWRGCRGNFPPPPLWSGRREWTTCASGRRYLGSGGAAAMGQNGGQRGDHGAGAGGPLSAPDWTEWHRMNEALCGGAGPRRGGGHDRPPLARALDRADLLCGYTRLSWPWCGTPLPGQGDGTATPMTEGAGPVPPAPWRRPRRGRDGGHGLLAATRGCTAWRGSSMRWPRTIPLLTSRWPPALPPPAAEPQCWARP